MSKLLQALQVRRTSNTKDIFSSIATITEEATNLRYLDATEYRVMVTLGSKVVVSEHSLSKQELDLAIKNVKRNIIEAVYGEFREDISMLREALYSRGILRATTTLDNLTNKMYGLGE